MRRDTRLTLVLVQVGSRAAGELRNIEKPRRHFFSSASYFGVWKHPSISQRACWKSRLLKPWACRCRLNPISFGFVDFLGEGKTKLALRLAEMQFYKHEMLQSQLPQLLPKRECRHSCKRHLQQLRPQPLAQVPSNHWHRGGSWRKHPRLRYRSQTVVEWHMTKRLQLEQQLQLQLEQPQKNEAKSPVPLLWRRRQVLACLTKLNNKLQVLFLAESGPGHYFNAKHSEKENKRIEWPHTTSKARVHMLSIVES